MLAVKCVSKRYFAQVDITLYQTLNADAALRQTVLASFSQSDSPRQECIINRAVRSYIVGSLFDKADLKSKEDISKTLKPYRVTQDNKDL